VRAAAPLSWLGRLTIPTEALHGEGHWYDADHSQADIAAVTAGKNPGCA
jgi:hypothetical protein